MPHRPVHIEFLGMPRLAAAEVATLRRLRGMEGQHSAVTEWSVRLEAAQVDEVDAPRFRATVRARIVGGNVLDGQSRESEALAALRLAFNRLEAELDAEQEQCRARAANWVRTVARRLAHRHTGDP